MPDPTRFHIVHLLCDLLLRYDSQEALNDYLPAKDWLDCHSRDLSMNHDLLTKSRDYCIEFIFFRSILSVVLEIQKESCRVMTKPYNSTAGRLS